METGGVRWSYWKREQEVAEFQDKIAHLDEEIAKEPTKKLTQRFQWLPDTGRAPRLRYKDSGSELAHRGSEVENASDEDETGEYGTDESGRRGNWFRRCVFRCSECGLRTRRVLWPVVRWVSVCTYVGALLWSCDAAFDRDFDLLDVALRGIPGYLAMALVFYILFGGRHKAARQVNRIVKQLSCGLFVKACGGAREPAIQITAPNNSGPADSGDPASSGACDPGRGPASGPGGEHRGGRGGIFPGGTGSFVEPRSGAGAGRGMNISQFLPAPEERLGKGVSVADLGTIRQQRPAMTSPYSGGYLSNRGSMAPVHGSQPTMFDNRHMYGGRRASRRLRDATEGVKMLGETDWQNLIEGGEPNSKGLDETTRSIRLYRTQYHTFRELLKKRLRVIANQPGAVVGTVVRNIIFCIIVFFTLAGARRTVRHTDWDYTGVSRELRIWDAALQWTLVADHVICFLAASNRLSFILRFKSLVDLLTLPLLYKVVNLAWPNNSPERLLFSVLRLFRLFRLESLLAYCLPSVETVSLILGGLATDTGVILTAFAAILFLLEAPRYDVNFTNIGDYLYYAVVTMTTVGYGDYSPITREGRWVTMGAILTAFIVLPYQVQRLLTALHIPPSIVGRQPSSTSDYILVFGKVRPRQLGVLLHEVVSCLPSAIKSVWVITPFPAVTFKGLVALFLQEYGVRVGVTHKFPTMEEMQNFTGAARAVFVLGDPTGGGEDNQTGSYTKLLSEDQSTFLRAAKIQPWCWPRVPVSVQLVHGMYAGLAAEMGAYHTVSLEILKLRCIARSLAGCPGFMPLVFNWFQTPSEKGRVMTLFNQLLRRKRHLESLVRRTYDPRNHKVEDEPELAGHGIVTTKSTTPIPPTPASVNVTVAANTPEVPAIAIPRPKKFTLRGSAKIPLHAMEELLNQTRSYPLPLSNLQDELNFFHFFVGLTYHVYRFNIPGCMRGLDYSLLTRVLYRRYRVLLIGLVTFGKKIFLNPVGHVIGSGQTALSGIMLAPSLDIVEEIETLSSFPVNVNSITQERQFLSQSLRTPPDLIASARSFYEDVRLSRDEPPPENSASGWSHKTTGLENPQRSFRAISGMSRGISDGITISPHRRRSAGLRMPDY
ncbi:ion channel protein, partial [Gregarina niphandrodes]